MPGRQLNARLGRAAWVLVVAAMVAGLAWKDCMLLAVGLVLSYRLFLLHMDGGAPWPALTAAVHAVSAGLMLVAAAVVLLAVVGLARLTGWHPEAPHTTALLTLVLAGAAWCCLWRVGAEGKVQELRCWTLLLAGVLLAIDAHQAGLDPVLCILVAGVGMSVLWAGWRLARVVASGLLRAGDDSL